MINGPGTHSGDADRNLIVADGFLREGSNLPTSEPRFLSPKASFTDHDCGGDVAPQ